MRILVVSPFPPRRCGIGTYARDQVRRLRGQGHHVTVLSPPDGEGDEKVSFYGGRPFLRAAAMKGFDRIVVHFQPALYYRPRRPLSKVMTSLALLRLARRRPELDILVHEADPPVLWRPDYSLLRLAFASAGTVSFHTESERDALMSQYHVDVRAAIVPHEVATPKALSRDEARTALGISNGAGPVYVCAGFLQPSKGFDRAVDAFGAGADGRRLYIVGSVRDRTPENEGYARALRERCRSVPGVTLVERFLSDDEFDLWVAAADWLVLPYRRSWSSGVLARAHSIGTPSIVSAVGGLPEQAGHGDLVVRNDEELARALRGDGKPTGGLLAPTEPHAEAAFPSHHYESHHHSHVPEQLYEWDPDLETPVTKKGRNVLIGLILISVALAALAQLTLKHGMNQVTSQGEIPLSLSHPTQTFVRVVSNLSVWAGLLTFVASAGVWIIVLSRTSLSFAYPFASLTYVLILLFDRLVLQEPVSLLRWGGVALIISGLLLVSRTHHV